MKEEVMETGSILQMTLRLHNHDDDDHWLTGK